MIGIFLGLFKLILGFERVCLDFFYLMILWGHFCYWCYWWLKRCRWLHLRCRGLTSPDKLPGFLPSCPYWWTWWFLTLFNWVRVRAFICRRDFFSSVDGSTVALPTKSLLELVSCCPGEWDQRDSSFKFNGAAANWGDMNSNKLVLEKSRPNASANNNRADLT